MKVTTTVNGTSSFVLLVADDGSTLNLLMKHGETAADALKRAAEECRYTASRLHKRAKAYDAGVDTVLGTVPDTVPDTVPTDEALEAIADQHMGIKTLATRNTDDEDFHQCAVWALRAALVAAWQAGHDAARS